MTMTFFFVIGSGKNGGTYFAQGGGIFCPALSSSFGERVKTYLTGGGGKGGVMRRGGRVVLDRFQ